MVTATAKMVFLAVFLFFFENFLAKGTGERTEKQAVLLAKEQGISITRSESNWQYASEYA